MNYTIEGWCVIHFIWNTTGTVDESSMMNYMCVPVINKVLQLVRKRRDKSICKAIPIIDDSTMSASLHAISYTAKTSWLQ